MSDLEEYVVNTVLAVGSPTGWWLLGAVAVGALLGAAGSQLTRWFLPEARVAGSWWWGAVLTAAALAVLAWRVEDRGALLVYAGVAVLAVPLSVIDWCTHRLPRAIVWSQLAVAVAGFAVLSLVRGDAAPGLRALGALVALAALFAVVAVATSGGVGAGDVSLAAVIGVVTGWSGWPAVAGCLVVASLLALVLLALPGVRARTEQGSATVPFGPCLCAATLLVVAWVG